LTKVAVIKGPRSLETVYKALSLIEGLDELFRNALKVLIKVNFIAVKTYETGVTTDPLVVEAIINQAKKFTNKIFVVESNATTTNADKAFHATGMDKMCERTGVEFLNLSKERDKIQLPVPNAEVLHKIEVPEIVKDATIISAAKLKPHNETGVTLGIKNMFGLLPDKLKAKYHLQNINKVIVDVNTVLKPSLVVIDGFYALEGPGPVSGSPIKMDIIIAGRDPVATDAVGCRIMGIDPNEIYHVRRAYEKGLGEIEKIEVAGEKIENVARKFRRT